MTRSREEITSADLQILGFEYQHLFFMMECLNMITGEEVGYEAKDDVHKLTAKGQAHLFQLKHTVDDSAGGSPKDISVLSSELWKSLSNWAKLITDSACGRNSIARQRAFLSQTHFTYTTNRGTHNDFISAVEQLQTGLLCVADFRKNIDALYKQTKSEELKNYIKNVLALKDEILEAFINRLSFRTTGADLIKTIKDKIREKMVPEEYIDDIFVEILGQIKLDFFNATSARMHQIITYSEWRLRYMPFFRKYRNTPLPLREFKPVLPAKLEQQTFIGELLEIGVIDNIEDEYDDIAAWSSMYLEVRMQLEQWYEDGCITQSEKNNFHRDAINSWRNIHRQNHRTTKNDETLDFRNAIACFDQVLLEKLSLLEMSLGSRLSNGEFIHLAEEQLIGWKYEWRKKYDARSNS